MVKQKMAVIPLPPYSPDLAPCDFFLIPKMKLKLKGCQFDAIEEIQAKLQRVLDTVARKGLPGSVPKMQETTRPYGEFYDFYSISPKYFGYPPHMFRIMLLLSPVAVI
jgi:hypothetical protein